jgi:hypothetical protein
VSMCNKVSRKGYLNPKFDRRSLLRMTTPMLEAYLQTATSEQRVLEHASKHEHAILDHVKYIFCRKQLDGRIEQPISCMTRKASSWQQGLRVLMSMCAKVCAPAQLWWLSNSRPAAFSDALNETISCRCASLAAIRWCDNRLFSHQSTLVYVRHKSTGPRFELESIGSAPCAL